MGGVGVTQRTPPPEVTRGGGTWDTHVPPQWGSELRGPPTATGKGLGDPPVSRGGRGNSIPPPPKGLQDPPNISGGGIGDPHGLGGGGGRFQALPGDRGTLPPPWHVAPLVEGGPLVWGGGISHFGGVPPQSFGGARPPLAHAVVGGAGELAELPLEVQVDGEVEVTLQGGGKGNGGVKGPLKYGGGAPSCPQPVPKPPPPLIPSVPKVPPRFTLPLGSW